ncbi:hypothetical protein DL546_005012 [Coniochaeta pulveracea]|uniref:Uncharacterized protein n=1 Tax=Coniochaeta pulveracea TaxID=177199 RepID=A0A420Y1Q9_9PEZI|nr:hypothetical protein DL546_005012 [Coniochaeta pulveracea]
MASNMTSIITSIVTFILGALHLLVTGTIVIFMFFVLIELGVGPALEAPKQLNIIGRSAYYASHRRFRDIFIGLLLIWLLEQCSTSLREGTWRRTTWKGVLAMIVLAFLASLLMIIIEAHKYRDQPWSLEEARLWTKGMTRSEFLQRPSE